MKDLVVRAEPKVLGPYPSFLSIDPGIKFETQYHLSDIQIFHATCQEVKISAAHLEGAFPSQPSLLSITPTSPFLFDLSIFNQMAR